MIPQLYLLVLTLSLTSVTFTGVVLYNKLATGVCPAPYGRTCNHHGTCLADGACLCDPQFSGLGCDEPACPGYLPESGLSCSGRGVCAPLLRYTQIPAQCKTVGVVAWESATCQAHLATGAGAATRPQCLCAPGHEGADCSLLGCPKTAELLVCGGNGNKTVGRVRNDTMVGDGCQCTDHFSLQTLRGVLGPQDVELILTRYLADFKRGFCGSAEFDSGGALILSQSTTTHTRCYCDERHTGTLCDEGVCPAGVDKQPCSGNGHPDVGFGLVRAGPLPLVGALQCKPVCTPPSVMCDGRCSLPALCATKEVACPPERPYRCSTRQCVANLGRKCGRGYISGALDDLDAVVGSIECTPARMAALGSDSARRTMLNQCLGVRGTMRSDGQGFASGGTASTYTDSRVYLVTVVPYDGQEGWVNVTYGGQAWNSYSAGGEPVVVSTVMARSLALAARYSASAHPVVALARLDAARFTVTPNPLVRLGQGGDRWRFTNEEGGRIVGQMVSASLVTLALYGTEVLAESSDGLALTRAGTWVDLQTCREDPVRLECAWDWEGRSLRSVYLCHDNTTWSVSASECADWSAWSAPQWTRVQTSASFTAADAELELTGEWVVEQPDPALPALVIQASMELGSVRVVVEADIWAPCVCPHYGKNWTTLDAEWLAQPYRAVGSAGDLVVGRIQEEGVVWTVRGVSVSARLIRDAVTGEVLEMMDPGRQISRAEFGTGTPGVELDYQGARCADGRPGALVYAQVLVPEECTCSIANLGDGALCDCESPRGVARECAGCGPQDALNETCTWTPARSDVRYPSQPVLQGNTSWVVAGTLEALPLLMTFSPCNATYGIHPAVPVEEHCGEDDQMQVRFNWTLVPPGANHTWVFWLEVAPRLEYVENLGGMPSLGGLYRSSGDSAESVGTTSSATWDSGPWDHDIYVEYQFLTPQHLVSVYVDFVTVGLAAAGGAKIIPVTVYIQILVGGGKWATVHKHRDSVVNGTARYTFAIADDRWTSSVRLYSHFPLEVRSFIPFVSQGCTGGNLTGTPDVYTSEARGIRDWLAGGEAQFEYLIELNETLEWRWTRPGCDSVQCPRLTCPDGTCVDALRLCPTVLYNCPGDGCVRSDINSARYGCACAQGRGGTNCGLHECVPGDPLTGLINPNLWCTVNGPSPLRIQPPYELIYGGNFKGFTDRDIMALNRPQERQSATDVGWVRVRAEKAPYGVPLLRLVRTSERNQTVFFSNCPYRVRTRLGLYLELEECVASRTLASPHEVLQWKTLGDGEVIQWASETQYDAAPYRCPAGHCVAHERDCYSEAVRDPMCGGGASKGLVDGTCLCERGKRTFLITEELSQLLSVPYARNPTLWGKENNNRAVSAWCRGRNCTEADCSPPRGCFPGTPARYFLDKWITCRDGPWKGQCAVNIHDCSSGAVEEPLVCSGLGELRRRDYHEGEWYCACGAVRDGVFRPNGHGGRNCGDYNCQDDANRIWYATTHPNTEDRFLDINGVALPGRWQGPCGATVGANPDDSVAWSSCCPGRSRLEACTNVLCLVGGTTRCLPIPDCMGSGRIPQVFVCNGKGKALADGTCLCDRDTATGRGYRADLDVYSTKGCYAPTRCGIAEGGTPCNSGNPCKDLSTWTGFPADLAYIRQQELVLVYREGLPMTNQSIVSRLVSDNLDRVILQGYVDVALGVQASMRAAGTDVCWTAADTNCTAPIAMLPCGDVPLVYMQAILSPYSLSPYVTGGTNYSILSDGLFATLLTVYAGQANPPRVQVGASGTLVVEFSGEYYLDVIRIHMASAGSVSISFTGAGGVEVCQTTLVASSPTALTWRDVFCLVQYLGVRFDIDYPAEWGSRCRDDETSLGCEQWMQTTCVLIPGGVVRPAGSLRTFPGCNDLRCCVASHAPYEPTRNVTIAFSSATTVDELSFFGHTHAVVDLPVGVSEEFIAASGQDQCVDEGAFFHPDLGLGGHLSYKRPVSAPPGDLAEAREACEVHGSKLAVPLGSVGEEWIEEAGVACYDGRALAGLGCLVGARERTEQYNPANLNHLLDSRCTTYGCFYITETITMAWYSAVSGGSLYNSPTFDGQASWVAFFEAVNQAYYSTIQGNYPLHYRIADDNVLYANLVDPPPIGPDFESLFGDQQTENQPYSNTEHPEPPSPSPTAVPAFIPDRTIMTYWVNPQQCIISFFTNPNCGRTAAVSTFGYREGWGAKITFVVHPSNYAQMFNGRNFIDGTYNYRTHGRCVDYQAPFDDAGGEVGCLGAGNSPTLSQGTTSFMVQGPCEVYIASNLGNTGWRGPNFYYGTKMYFYNPDRNAWIWPASFFLRNFGRRAEEGCYPQIGVPYSPAIYDHQFFDTGQTKLGTISGIYFRPQFAATRVIFSALVERADSGAGTDGFTMGYVNHPYMCIAIYAKADIRVVAGQQLLSDTFVEILAGTVPMAATTTSGIFYHSSCSGTCTVAHTFTPCTNVIPCTQCQVRTTGDWRLHQEVYYEYDFADVFDAFDSPYISIMLNGVTLDSLVGTRRYVGIQSISTPARYLAGNFNLNSCVAVKGVGSSYVLEAVACDEGLYPLCIRDLIKYAAVCGTQCDVCGPCSRTEAIAPGVTVFDLYPDASEELNPFGFRVLRAYLDGSLELLVADLDLVPWDRIRAHLFNISIIFAFPEAMDFLLRGVSTRPAYLSDGAEADPVSWLDFDFARMFQYDCGLVADRFTGIERQRCAVSKEYCISPGGFEAGPMDPDDVPTIFTSQVEVSSTNPMCGEYVDPSQFHRYDSKGGGPQPATAAYTILSETAGVLKFKVLETNGTCTNTGRRIPVSLRENFTVVGSVVGSVTSVGSYRLWAGSVSPTFGRSATKEYLGEWTPLTEPDFNTGVTQPQSQVLSVLGLDFVGVQVGSTLSLGKWLVSTPTTMAVCALGFPNVSYVELPSSVQSYAPRHECMYSDSDEELAPVGTCYCSPESGWGGPDCEWPTVTTPARGKKVCNRFGDSGGQALASDFTVVPVISSLGVYYDPQGYQCKCASPALALQTIPRPAAINDYAYITRRDKLPNADEFILVIPPQDIAVPVVAADVRDVCNAEAAALPSWNTGYETMRLDELASTSFFVDLARGDGLYLWDQRDETFVTDDYGSVTNNPCTLGADLCEKINWNNLVYLTSGSHLVDGLDAATATSLPITIALGTTTDDVTVEVVATAELATTFTVKAGSNTCTRTSERVNQWDCLFDSVASVTLTGTSGTLLRELRVTSKRDTGRVVGYFDY